MRGRKPELKLVSTNSVATRSPRAPATLGTVGKNEWRRVAPALAHAGLLNEESKALLVQYCGAVEAAAECAAILKKQGRILKVKDGPPKAHPAVRQELQYQNMSLRLAEALGITATAKQRAANRKAPPNAASGVFD